MFLVDLNYLRGPEVLRGLEFRKEEVEESFMDKFLHNLAFVLSHDVEDAVDLKYLALLDLVMLAQDLCL